jgi:hypothetical protein
VGAGVEVLDGSGVLGGMVGERVGVGMASTSSGVRMVVEEHAADPIRSSRMPNMFENLKPSKGFL